MKNLLKSAFLVLTVFLMTNTAIAQKTNQKAVIKTTLHCDHCKECETCGLKFKTEMLKIKGVKMYELDDKKMTFTIYYNPKKTTLQAIKEGIAKLGYDADEVKATSEGIASLDGCCKA
ncbi:heavy-metal-associated domain-containing protein [Flavobacterium wongokense]|uniref:heavy-metal-associated domain-containing protein n=1 Tax=Flavobacterium wongokense TaxID=2910674 RepID=UPI001F37E072|nr:heavy-metal-associated domain-containing protein [Flavobacterium sp. WG47]MCF6132803.1 heavy-metal-associated domain-containing protein [Flavobacterium sp. WG47]